MYFAFYTYPLGIDIDALVVSTRKDKYPKIRAAMSLDAIFRRGAYDTGIHS